MNLCCLELRRKQGQIVKEKDMFQVEVDKWTKTSVLDKCFVFNLFNGVHVHCFGGNTAVVVRIKLNSVAKLVETH